MEETQGLDLVSSMPTLTLLRWSSSLCIVPRRGPSFSHAHSTDTPLASCLPPPRAPEEEAGCHPAPAAAATPQELA